MNVPNESGVEAPVPEGALPEIFAPTPPAEPPSEEPSSEEPPLQRHDPFAPMRGAPWMNRKLTPSGRAAAFLRRELEDFPAIEGREPNHADLDAIVRRTVDTMVPIFKREQATDIAYEELEKRRGRRRMAIEDPVEKDSDLHGNENPTDEPDTRGPSAAGAASVPRGDPGDRSMWAAGSRGSERNRHEKCVSECIHLLPSPSGDRQSSEYRKCYRACMGAI